LRGKGAKNGIWGGAQLGQRGGGGGWGPGRAAGGPDLFSEGGGGGKGGGGGPTQGQGGTVVPLGASPGLVPLRVPSSTGPPKFGFPPRGFWGGRGSGRPEGGARGHIKWRKKQKNPVSGGGGLKYGEKRPVYWWRGKRLVFLTHGHQHGGPQGEGPREPGGKKKKNHSRNITTQASRGNVCLLRAIFDVGAWGGGLGWWLTREPAAWGGGGLRGPPQKRGGGPQVLLPTYTTPRAHPGRGGGTRGLGLFGKFFPNWAVASTGGLSHPSGNPHKGGGGGGTIFWAAKKKAKGRGKILLVKIPPGGPSAPGPAMEIGNSSRRFGFFWLGGGTVWGGPEGGLVFSFPGPPPHKKTHPVGGTGGGHFRGGPGSSCSWGGGGHHGFGVFSSKGGGGGGGGPGRAPPGGGNTIGTAVKGRGSPKRGGHGGASGRGGVR